MCSRSKHGICQMMRPLWELLDPYFLPYCAYFRSAGVLDLHTMCADGPAPFRRAGHHPCDYRSAKVLRRAERNHWIQTVRRSKVRGHSALRPAPWTVDLRQQVCQSLTFSHLRFVCCLLCLRLRHELPQLRRLNAAETVLIIDLLRCYRALKAFRVAACGLQHSVVSWWMGLPFCLCQHLRYLSNSSFSF